VKKAVNWALRQIGKRNGQLRTLALQCASDIQRMDSNNCPVGGKGCSQRIAGEKD